MTVQPAADPDQVVSPNAHPVDSATRRCCGGIGRHTAECAANRELRWLLANAAEQARHAREDLEDAASVLPEGHHLAADLAAAAISLQRAEGTIAVVATGVQR
ncbi:hypothetical protein VT930_09585 [Mycobacterium sherrisii]|uniref:hypothetical protein n=1 Tax=Mycobacterium sherrisii TaxID=243061 RepID=UPI002DDD7BF4|nr:hypothetical protein [Mycobacterium sherrisii]MEC4763355.1 hypothetical protein [Mycobacterium sherrisii]